MMKYELIYENEKRKQYPSLKQISEELDIPIYIVRDINAISMNHDAAKSKKNPHYLYKEIYQKIKIINLKKELKDIFCSQNESG